MFLVGTVFGMGLLLLVQRLMPSAEEADIAHYREVRDFVTENFVGDVDAEEMVSSALKAMVSDLDPYSRYYDEVESIRVDRETQGRFVGIGVVFRTVTSGQVLFPLEDSPAREAGLEVGDTILDLDGFPIEGATEEDIRAALRGEPGSVVEIRARGLDGEERVHQVRRRSLLDPTVRHVRVLDAERGLGYMAITSFSHETVAEFTRALEQLRRVGVRGLVLDLRGNPGGILGAAIELAQRFVPSGVIVSTEGRGAPVTYGADPTNATLVGLPLVVLVDRASASASEVLAGALQDHRAAVIVGEPTHGKGVVQTIRRFDEHGTIAKVTSSYYYTPAHRNLERNPEEGRDYGIVPDVEVEMSAEELRAVQRYLARYGPPVDARAAIESWERAEGVELLEPAPADPQLEVALELLRGNPPAESAQVSR